MIYAEEAQEQIAALEAHFERLGRPEATRNLLEALIEAERFITQRPERGLQAPRPYPSLVREGRLWVKARRLWVWYAPMEPPVIYSVFFDSADIPRRV